MAPYPYETEFPSLDLDRPEEGILRLTLRAEGRLNAVSEEQHGEVARVWQAIGQDEETRAVLVRGAAAGFAPVLPLAVFAAPTVEIGELERRSFMSSSVQTRFGGVLAEGVGEALLAGEFALLPVDACAGVVPDPAGMVLG